MQLHQIRYFLETVDRLHFGRSAAKLGVSQPSLSRGIQLLEQELGGSLLERRRSRMRLSPLGRLVLPDLRAAMHLLDQAGRAARLFTEANTRAVSLVVSDEASHLFHTAIFDGIGRMAEGQSLKLDKRPQSEVVAAMMQGAYDIGLLLEEEQSIAATPFWRSPLVIAFPPNRSVPTGDVTLTDLASEPFIVREGRRFEMSITSEMERAGLTRRVAHTTNDDVTQLMMFREKLGCVILPAEQAKALLIDARPLRCATTLSIVLAHRQQPLASPTCDGIVRTILRNGILGAAAWTQPAAAP